MRDDSPLTLDDFLHSGRPNSIPKKFTNDLTPEDLEQIIALNERYSEWLKSNNYYDDIDLALAAWAAVKGRPPALFDEIYLDEAQDLTRVEFRVLECLLNGESRLPNKGIRVALAGDPQQTINPTGFNWTQIRALFYKGEPLRVR